MKNEIIRAFNKQLNEEMYSAYLYLAMSAHFEDVNLKGFANWMRVQAQEETAHAMKFYNHILDRGCKVELGEIKKPKGSWETPQDAFKDAYEHEQYITGCINDLVDMAEENKDRPAVSFLQWFIDEQVEEEATADDIVQQLQLIKDNPGGLFMLDKELGQRVFDAAEYSPEE